MRLHHTEMKALLDSLPNELAEEESVNVFHCKQGDGNDRLYITRKPDSYLFYCHHCGSSGCYRIKFSKVKSITTPTTTKRVRKRHPSGDSSRDLSKWSIGARAWTTGALLTTEEVKGYGLAYSREDGRVWLPLFQGGKRVGWLGRGIEETSPKYMLSKQDDFLFHINHNPGDMLVIVEDALSAIRVGRQFNCVALMGTSLSDYAKNELTPLYNSYKIWLDNDNPQVKMKQVKLRNQLSVFGSIEMIKTDKDPKEYSDGEIKSICE